MTLFKKVFQPQARPAQEEEMPDAQQLQDATVASPEQPSPLLLEDDDQAVRLYELEQTCPDYQTRTSTPSATKLEVQEATDQQHCAISEREYVEQEHCGETDFAAIMEQTANRNDEDAEPTTLAQPKEKLGEHGGMREEMDLSCEIVDNGSPDLRRISRHTDNDARPDLADVATPQKEQLQNDSVAFARQQMETLKRSSQNGSETGNEDRAYNGGVTDLPSSDLSETTKVDAPTMGRANRRVERAKTRLLGFNRDTEAEGDPFMQVADSTATPQREKFPVGWLVIVDGPGTGSAFSIFAGASMIGRGEGQMIRLNFGDNSISRQNHAAIAYDEEVNKFYIGHGGKSNIIRRNARPVLSTEELHHADQLRIGETTLRFVALCGSDFQWNSSEHGDASNV